MKISKFIILLFLILQLAFTVSSCSSQSFECYECGKSVGIEYDAAEDEDGNTHDVSTYMCKECSYEQGFIDGYNSLLDKIYDGDLSDIDYINSIPDDYQE